MANDQDPRAELQAQLPSSLELRFDEVFPNLTGWGVKKRNQKKAKVIARAEPVLRHALEDGEVIRHVAVGIRNVWWEAVTIGWITYYMNHTTLVLTDRRVLAIHTDTSHKPRLFANSIALDRVKKTKTGLLFGYLNLKLGKGSLQYTRIAKAEATRFKALMPGRPNASGGAQHLCPACFLTTDDYGEVCGRCGAEFKDPKVAALRSLVVPGLGDWYLGHRGFALFEMFGSAVGWLLLLWSLFMYLVTTDPEAKVGALGSLLFFGVAVALGHIVDAAVTHGQAKKGQHSMDLLLPTTAKPIAMPKGAAGGVSTPTGVR